MADSRPGSRMTMTSSPASTTVSAVGTRPGPSLGRTEMTSAPSGRPMSTMALPAAGAPSRTSTSMISSCSRSRSRRWTRPYCGTSCSISRRIRSVAETAGWIPRSLKCSRFRGLLTRATIRATRYFSFATWQMRMLSSSSPVTAMTRSARWMPARSRTQSSVASPYWTACSSSSSTVRYRGRDPSMSVTSWSLAMSSRARFQPTLPAPAMITYTRSGPRPEGRLDHHVDRGLRRRDDVHPVGVPGGARRVEHAGHDLRHLEPLLGDLGDHEVGVVPVRRGDEHVGAIDAGLGQRVDLQRGPDGELAAAVLPRPEVGIVEALVGEQVLVEHGDLAALVERALGDRRSHTAGADDEDERHGPPDYPRAAEASPSAGSATGPAPSASRAGAVRITRHGA